MKTLVLILVLNTLALAWELPPGLELVSTDGNHVTVRDVQTGMEDTYLIEGEPIMNGWTLDPAEDSLIFELVADLNMFLTEDLQSYDFLNDGYIELVGGDLIIGGPLVFLENDGNFGFTEVLRIDSPNKIFDLGDADNDGFIDILTKNDRSMYIYEQTAYNTYADSLVWQITPLEGSYRVWPRYSDLDDDGLMEVSFQNSLGFRKIDIYENSGDNEYDNNFNIPWPNLGPGQFASGDFDGDGKTEIVGGSDYGVLSIFESVESDSFVQVWQGNLGHNNAYMHRFIGDTDNDGYGEWVSGSHDFSRGGFFFKVFEGNGNNQYHEIYYDSLPGNPWRVGGINAGDIDDDGIPEFLFSSNFNVGVYQYNSIAGWHRVWHLDSLQGTVFPYLVDTNGDGTEEVVIATSRIPNYTRVYKLLQTGVQAGVKPVSQDLFIYPNPANDNVIIQFTTMTEEPIHLEIYDIRGRKIYSDKIYTLGETISWPLTRNDGKEVSSGLYFIKLHSGNIKMVNKITILK